MGGIITKPFGKPGKLLSKAWMQLPAIAARRAPADALGIHKHDLLSGLGEVIGGGNTGKPRPHHADITACVAR